MRFSTVLALVAVVFLAGCTTANKTPSEGTSGAGAAATGVEHEIEITSAGFSPRLSTIKAGDMLTFINKDDKPHRPASDVHPTHKVYPGSGIEKCGTSEQKDIFDSCKGLNPGEKYSFTFFESGSWCFHDHLKPDLKGCVDV